MVTIKPIRDEFLNVSISDTIHTDQITIDVTQEPESESKKAIFYKRKAPYNISKKRLLFTRSIKTYPI